MTKQMKSEFGKLRGCGVAVFGALLMIGQSLQAGEKLKALIVDGQNNHEVWPKSTLMMKHYLEGSGLFEVDVARTHYLWKAEREAAFLPLANAGVSELLKEPKADPAFKPDFSKYAVIVSNFGWKAADWPEETRRAFEKYMAEGGGLAEAGGRGDVEAGGQQVAGVQADADVLAEVSQVRAATQGAEEFRHRRPPGHPPAALGPPRGAAAAPSADRMAPGRGS